MVLNIDDNKLKKAMAYDTAKEITQQPSTWIKTVQLVMAQQEAIRDFLSKIGKIGSYDIILMGAGTSEYIGNALLAALNPQTDFSVRSIPTTDMVLCPAQFISKDRPTLFISYGRSGNSPESVGALKAVEAVTNLDHHLIITCNADGALHHYSKQMRSAIAILLPEETNDLGFAMTGSFTNAVLATYLVFNLDHLKELEKYVKAAADNIDKNILSYAKTLQTLIGDYEFKRIVYLGSLSMKGYAQESCLKVLELTAGKIATLFDSFLGLRHGPKSFIDPESLIVAYISDDEEVRRYELDLCEELKRQQKGYKLVVISHRPIHFTGDVNIRLDYHEGQPMILVGLQMMILAHILAFSKSYAMGMTTDNPCPTGEVNRVVTGVTIYPVERR